MALGQELGNVLLPACRMPSVLYIIILGRAGAIPGRLLFRRTCSNSRLLLHGGGQNLLLPLFCVLCVFPMNYLILETVYFGCIFSWEGTLRADAVHFSSTWFGCGTDGIIG